MAKQVEAAWRGGWRSIRRPTAADLSDGAVVSALRESGEIIADSTRATRSAASSLARAMVALFILPALGLPVLLAAGAAFPGKGQALLAIYVVLAFFGYVAWQDCFKPEWRGRLRRRGERLRGLEDIPKV